jgi:uncharacterized membrane protein
MRINTMFVITGIAFTISGSIATMQVSVLLMASLAYASTFVSTSTTAPTMCAPTRHHL